ncbi:hypothetical protein [Risungbinella massiliensis]|uniref:hypothetical protein n=1 Tax=Risungbinella massiliensis TaxID=1329796 RepID=UPI0005CB8848|nr:hypothetical protein [Risungbinella massiliensis]
MDRRDQNWFRRELEFDDTVEEELAWQGSEDLMLEIDQALKSLPKVTPPHSITDQMWDQLLSEEIESKPKWKRKPWIWLSGVAAIISFSWLAGYLFWEQPTESYQLDQATMSGASESVSQKTVQPLSALSPDGEHLATWEENKLHVRDLKGNVLFTSDEHPQLMEVQQLVWKDNDSVEVEGVESSSNSSESSKRTGLKRILIEIPILRR